LIAQSWFQSTSSEQRYDYTFYCSSCAPLLFVVSSLTGHSLLVRPGDLCSQHIRWALATAPGAWRKCIGQSTRLVFLTEGSMPPATRAHPCRAVAAGTPRRRAFLKMPQIHQGRTRVRPCQSNTLCKLSKLTTVRIEWLGARAPERPGQHSCTTRTKALGDCVPQGVSRVESPSRCSR
jgi:hypothetical protein